MPANRTIAAPNTASNSPVAASGAGLRNHAWCARKYTTNRKFFTHSARPSSSVINWKPARLKNSSAISTTAITRERALGAVAVGGAVRRSERKANATITQIKAMIQPVT